MKNFAEITNGKVTNVVVADDDVAAQLGLVLLPDTAGIGWDYSNGVFVDNRPQPDPAPAAPTKEQLMAQLAALSAQIQALE